MTETVNAKAPSPMFDIGRKMKFHLELTDKCNAACPMCGRTQQLNRCLPDMTKVRNIDLDLATIKRNFPTALCQNILEIDLCGGLGDPAAARDCFDICEYFITNGIRLIFSSNAGLRSASWWERLGRLFVQNDSLVEFHIDGLADTNHLYRLNTRFNKIMENAKAFLGTGAKAEWHFIPFEHNQHQIAEALALSRDMGFIAFKVIDTIRFGKNEGFDYQMPDGSLRQLRPADQNVVARQLGRGDESNAQEALESTADLTTIRCKSLEENRPYIVATGAVSACCWVEGSDDEKNMYQQADRDPIEHNVNHRLLSDILMEEPYRSIYSKAWDSAANPVCIRKCGKMRRSTREAF